MADFSNYELTPGLNVYELADGLLPEIAEAAGFELTPEPDAGNLGQFIGRLGPDKELQKNIGLVHETLGEDSVPQIADWIDRSGIMYPVERGFLHDKPLPQPEAIMFTGGVANWMLRRAYQTLRLDPYTREHGNVYIPVGNREMKLTEHQLVDNYRRRRRKLPTEADFVETYITYLLKIGGFKPQVFRYDTDKGSEIMGAFFNQYPGMLNRQITVVANAPNAIQATGEIRLAARAERPTFDSTGQQLFMVSDSFPIARRGEAAKTHQNPVTALGQLGRNALYLVRNQAEL